MGSTSSVSDFLAEEATISYFALSPHMGVQRTYVAVTKYAFHAFQTLLAAASLTERPEAPVAMAARPAASFRAARSVSRACR